MRESAGIFDVSHMTVVDVSGEDAREYLRYILANDVAKLDKEGLEAFRILTPDALICFGSTGLTRSDLPLNHEL